MAISDAYHAELSIITAAFAMATEHEADCDVCAAIIDMVPRDVPAFIAALDRVGPMSGPLAPEPVTVGGVWTFSRDAILWHESQHGACPQHGSGRHTSRL
jgi:hypothetical protein